MPRLGIPMKLQAFRRGAEWQAASVPNRKGTKLPDKSEKVLLTGRRSSALRHYCASSVRERCELPLSTERNGGRFDDGSSDQLPEMQKLHGRGFYSRWNRRRSSHNRRMV